MALPIFEFGDFRLDCDRFELCRAGRSLKLERKPLELLILLAEKNGHLVTRAEISSRLWGQEVFVDTEHGINTAVRKIRQVLRDDPERPSFVQTVTGKGYRFVGALTVTPASLPADSEALSLNSDSTVTDSVVSPAASSDADTKKPSTKKPSMRIWVASLLAVLTAAVLLFFAIKVFALKQSPPATSVIRSLAVLPLENLSGDRGQDYFADGMTDELITMLAKNSTLRVTSRTSVMQFKNSHLSLREIAQKLGVDGVVEGSVVRTGNRVHLNVQLIDAQSDEHVWAESFDRDGNDAVALPRETALGVAKKLNRLVPQPSPERFVSREAHDAYLHGRSLWFTSHYKEAGEYFRKALALQPDYALGWCGLSALYGALAVEGQMSPDDSLAPAEEAALKAVALDDSLPEAHLALGAAIFIRRWDWSRAEQEVRRAIALDPNFAEGYHFLAKLLGTLNRHQEAIDAQRKASEIDTFARPWGLALAFMIARRYDAAIQEANLCLESTPNDVTTYWVLFETFRRQGAFAQAAQTLKRYLSLKGDSAAAEKLDHAFRSGGYDAVLRWQLSRLPNRSPVSYISPIPEAVLFAQLKRREETLRLLEEAYRQHSPVLLWVQTDPAFDFLHSDERYRSIIKRVGLPAAY